MNSATAVYNPPNSRSSTNVTLDGDVLRKLLQLAVDVELFTIPLYMSALYSIQGFQSAGGANDQWPGLGPKSLGNPSTDPYKWDSGQANQEAYDIIFSVYVQEMFHLQLAGNLLAAVGGTVKLTPPLFPPTDPHIIPGIGDLRKTEDPLYHDVLVGLGPLNENQIKLFMAIESPDWTVSHDFPKPPYASVADVPSAFDSIGQLYETIDWYLKLQYSDGTKLWHKVYDPAANQVDTFLYGWTNPQEAYKFSVTLNNPDPDTAQGNALVMVDAITDQGEGASADDQGVATAYQPVGEQDGTTVQVLWDQLSHFERFKKIYDHVSEVTTWVDWHRTNTFKWQDFFVNPKLCTSAEQQQGVQRAGAYNNPATAGEVNELLDQAYVRTLETIADVWAKGSAFPFAAMQALSSRVIPVWAANGSNSKKGPTFESVTPPTIPIPGHACQGLNMCKGLDVSGTAPGPGLGNCALAVGHTCGGSNSCEGQGGCGYPTALLPQNGGYSPVSPPNFAPSDPSLGPNQGGCGAPIPVAQVFHNPYPNPNGTSPTQVNVRDAAGVSVAGSVWDRARSLFLDRALAKTVIDQTTYNTLKSNPPVPNNLRLVLPPS